MQNYYLQICSTIKEIITVLNENPIINIKIVGHTDSGGEDKLNLDLSKRCAASVKNSLVKDFSIDEARIETDCKGKGEPIAKNDGAVNKALNRRVEFIKLYLYNVEATLQVDSTIMKNFCTIIILQKAGFGVYFCCG
jgi:hypothetical protein